MLSTLKHLKGAIYLRGGSKKMSERDMQAYKEYAKKYAMRKPKPAAPNFANQSDWITKLTWPVVLSQILLVALRTAGGFYNAAAAEYPGVAWYPMAVAICAFIGIELGVVIYAANNARSNFDGSKKTRNGLFWVAIFFGALISIAAGLEQSSALIADLAPWLRDVVRWFLVITQGIFATLFAVIGGHLIGENLALVAAKRDENMDAYNAELEEWCAAMHRSWTSSAEYKALKGMGTPGARPQTVEGRVAEYLDKHNIGPARIKPGQLAYELDITPSQARDALAKLS